MKNNIYIYAFLFLVLSCSDFESEEIVYGCTDSLACNYNESANANNNSCYYEQEYYDCDGNCLSDSDNDQVCDEFDPCIGAYDNNYYCEDLHVLYDFIIENPALDSLNVFDILQISWFNDSGRLRYLSLANLNLTAIPESIGLLDSLETLYLNNNNFTSVPESICNLNSSCEIFIQNNDLCEEYHFNCIDHWEPQNCE